MNLIKSFYKIETEVDADRILKRLEKVARTCYKSEDKIAEGSAEKLIAAIIKRGHEAMLEHDFISVRFICDRGVSHEIVRHRICSFAQESTRYCNYGKSKDINFIIPCWLDIEPEIFTKMSEMYPDLNRNIWINAMLDAEDYYNDLITQGWKPEQARSVLPNSLKTEIVVTANLREWRKIFQLRTAKAAHPQMRELMIPLCLELKRLLPVIFDDIIIE